MDDDYTLDAEEISFRNWIWGEGFKFGFISGLAIGIVGALLGVWLAHS